MFGLGMDGVGCTIGKLRVRDRSGRVVYALQAIIKWLFSWMFDLRL